MRKVLEQLEVEIARPGQPRFERYPLADIAGNAGNEIDRAILVLVRDDHLGSGDLPAVAAQQGGFSHPDAVARGGRQGNLGKNRTDPFREAVRQLQAGDVVRLADAEHLATGGIDVEHPAFGRNGADEIRRGLNNCGQPSTRQLGTAAPKVGAKHFSQRLDQRLFFLKKSIFSR